MADMRRERERHIMLTRLYSQLRDMAEEALDAGLSEDDVRLAIWSAIENHKGRI